MPTIADSLTLPCGAVLPNRLAKAAMTEGLADPQGRATPELERLYGLWADGGSGLLISGNVQIDRDHLERPGNVIIKGPQDEAALTGLRATILSADAMGLVLDRPLDDASAIGDRASLREGCDHTVATCSTRFGNAANFQGEPFLPGNDLLAQYPMPR